MTVPWRSIRLKIGPKASRICFRTLGYSSSEDGLAELALEVALKAAEVAGRHLLDVQGEHGQRGCHVADLVTETGLADDYATLWGDAGGAVARHSSEGVKAQVEHSGLRTARVGSYG